MASLLKWLAIVAAGCALLLVAAAVALQQWLRSDDFRGRAERAAGEALGVPVTLGRLSVDLLPLPAVAIAQVRVATRPAITVERVEARPAWAALLAGRLEIDSLRLQQAVLPQLDPAKSTGQPTTLDVVARMGDGGVPRELSFEAVAGRFTGAHGWLRHEGGQWPLQLDIGGGRIHGHLQLAPAAKGGRLLRGQLQTDNVQVASLKAPSRTLTGRLQAQTTLEATFTDPGQLRDALQTQTRFSVRDAVVQGVDLARAVQTVGLSRGGSTRLDSLAGQLATRGRTVHLSKLVATSGLLAAHGEVTVAADQALAGRIAVDLGSTGVGVPLAVGGTVDAPSVTLSRGALVGAAVGTLLAPGVGTGAGAVTGDTIGRKLQGLFGK